MKKIFENKIFSITLLILVFGAISVIANTIGDSGFSGIQVDNYFAGSGKQGINQNISFNDSDGNGHSLEFEDGLLVNYSLIGSQTSLPASESLVAYYKLDDTTNTTVDSTGNYDGTARNGTITGATGKIGTAFEFDGIDDLVTISGLPRPATISVSAWVFHSPDADEHPIVGANDVNAGSSPIQSWNFGTYTDSFRSGVFTSNSSQMLQGIINISDGSFHHMVMTYNGNNVSVYLDGVLKNSTSSISGNINSGTGMALGSFSDIKFGGVSMFKGTIDEVGIWNVSLSQAEVEELYNNGAGLSY